MISVLVFTFLAMSCNIFYKTIPKLYETSFVYHSSLGTVTIFFPLQVLIVLGWQRPENVVASMPRSERESGECIH